MLEDHTWCKDALDLISKRYLPGEDISIKEWLHRVAGQISKHYPEETREYWQEIYFQMLYSRKFLPTSAALHNCLKGKGSLSGCIVLPLPKSARDIIQKAIPEIAEVLFSGIGVGIDLSVLPPRLSKDKESGRANPGPVELLCAITSSVDAPMAYGGFKRSAFMAALHVQHPDIFEFITLKKEKSLPNVNISIAIDDPFKEAIQTHKLVPILLGRKQMNRQHLAEMESQANARHLPPPDLSLRGDDLFSGIFQGIVGRACGNNLFFYADRILDFASSCAWSSGDPGLINLSQINSDNPTHPVHSDKELKGRGIISVTTPCGEQPLLPYEVCHLGSINIKAFADNGLFDTEGFKETVRTAVRFMDDLIDVGDNVLQEANVMSQANRKIGIGIMGFADALAELEIPYDSPFAVQFAENIGKELLESAVLESRQLANERGPFPAWEISKFAANQEPPRRHATLTTIAPTGHIATLAGCSTAIEPYFLISYGRNAAGLRQQKSHVLTKKLRHISYSLEDWIQATISQNPRYQFDGTLAGLSSNPTSCPEKNLRLQKLKEVFKTAHEISPDVHLSIVEAFQKYVENGISKTINLANHATIEDVKQVFIESIQKNLKGMTIFRDRCLEAQALFHINTCPNCGKFEALQPSDCAGLKCEPQKGGCGFETCQVYTKTG